MYVLELAGQDDAFAAAEAANAATEIEVIASGVATAGTLDLDRARGLAFTRRVSMYLGKTTASIEHARALLETTPTDRSGTFAVRARDVRGTSGVSTQRAERELGTVLTARGLPVDLESPDHELRVLFSNTTCVLGWLVTETTRSYRDRDPTKKPFFHPGSMEPLEARAVANLAGAGPGTMIADPMCGTGGILVEAGLLGATVLGIDAQRQMVEGTRENLTHYIRNPGAVIQGDAAHLPVCRDLDAVVADAPYGRQSKIAGYPRDELVLQMLRDIHALTPRAVVVCDKSLTELVTATPWTVEDQFKRPVHRSLTRWIHVLTPRAR